MKKKIPNEPAIGCSLVAPGTGAFALHVFGVATDPADPDAPIWPILGSHKSRSGEEVFFAMVLGFPAIVATKTAFKALTLNANPLPQAGALALGNHQIIEMCYDTRFGRAETVCVSAVVKHSVGSRVFYTHEVVPLRMDGAHAVIDGHAWKTTPWMLEKAARKQEDERRAKLPEDRQAIMIASKDVTSAHAGAVGYTEGTQEFIDLLLAPLIAALARANESPHELSADSFAQAFSRRVRST